MKNLMYLPLVLCLTLSCTDQEMDRKSAEQQKLEGSLNFILSNIPFEYRLEVSEKISKSFQIDLGFNVEPSLNLLTPTTNLQTAKTPPVPSGGDETSRCYWSYLTAEIVHTEVVDHGDDTAGIVFIFDDGCSQIIWVDGQPGSFGGYQTGYDASCYCD